MGRMTTRKKAEPISIEAQALAAAKAAYTGPHAASLWVDVIDGRKVAVCVRGDDGSGQCIKAIIREGDDIAALAQGCALVLAREMRDGR